jgi:hypothetical protein
VLAQLRHLRTLDVVEFAGRPNRTPPIPATRINGEELAEAVAQLTHMTALKLRVEGLDETHLTRIILALPLLSSLDIASPRVKILEWLTQTMHLVATMHQLTIRMPSVPRDHIAHIQSLRALTALNIDGSFTEPLFA